MDIATAIAPSNIAFVKYWGNRNRELRLPLNNSLSMALSGATTTTTVALDSQFVRDRLVLNGENVQGPALERVVRHLDLIRQLAGRSEPAMVISTNSFPTGTGIASSASAFAALTLAATAACGLELSERQLTVLARRGSGSAARSIPGGFVEWLAADRDEASYARSIAPPEHWQLWDLVLVVSREHKAVGSSAGHDAAMASPYLPARLSEVEPRFQRVRRAVLERDLYALGPELEAEALSLHAVAMTSRPALLYWQPATVAALHQVRSWREQGLAVYFTLDAGPNVHLICQSDTVGELERLVRRLPYVESVLVNQPAGPARLARPEADLVAAELARPT